ncbi:MAG: phosphotransferase, partial [Thermomicrobia bacterium]|nr:phosphotransferase [Thermomicrobia bacterium]
MLERPDVSDETLLACLRDDYRLHAIQVVFLPLGNDVNTAVFRVVADDRTPYFLKLRSGPFDEPIVAIPRFLHDQGIAQVIPPLATTAGRLWARVDGYAMMVFPFVAGRNGVESPLSEHQWSALGAALRRMHAVVVPPSLRAAISQETYAPYWRDRVRMFQARVAEPTFTDPIAAALAAFLHARRDEVSKIVARAEALGATLRAQAPRQVLCHADLHAVNILIGTD